MTSNTLLERLARLDSCAVSDALDSLQMSNVLLGLSALSSQKKIAGTAVTVKLGENDGRASKRHLGTAAVEAGDANSVIVVQHEGRTNVAGWGGILSTAASKKGIAGVVIDGAARDVDQSRELDFPVYGRNPIPITARGRMIELDWNIPVTLCGVSIAPGDYILADGSGVVAIPAAQAEAVINTAEKIMHKEQLMEAAVKAGRPVSEVMGANYEDMLKEFGNEQ